MSLRTNYSGNDHGANEIYGEGEELDGACLERRVLPLRAKCGGPSLRSATVCFVKVWVMEKTARRASENGDAFSAFPQPRLLLVELMGHDDRSRSFKLRGCELLTDFAGFGIEADEKFVRQGDADHLARLACGTETLLEGDEVGFVTAHYTGHDEEDFAD